MKSKRYSITGIGTDVGKTVVSAILAEALHATYWKPIQAGDLENSDSVKIKTLTNNIDVLPEAYRLSEPMSPHAAAAIDGVEIQLKDLDMPIVDGNLIIEGAGGLMVPINSNGLMYVDVFAHWKIPTIVVSRHYLGSINHTLLTLEILKQRNVEVAGIIFVGEENTGTESIILKISGLKMIARIPLADEVNEEFIRQQAKSTQIAYFFMS